MPGTRPRRRGATWLLCAWMAAFTMPSLSAQEPASQDISQADLRGAIDQLGHLDYDTRSGASRTVRRSSPEQAVPALMQAVAEHPDGYVRFRALVLLTGFNDPRTRDMMLESMSSPNDRLRIVAFNYFAHHPDASLADDLLQRLESEVAEFVRPPLVRALAAHASSDAVRQALIREAGRGEDFFRSAVIEALGDFRAGYAFDALTAVAKLDGPLQDDAALALGRLGDKRALSTLAELQQTAPRQRQPLIAAAICLLEVNCAVHEPYVIATLRFAETNPGFQEHLRSAATALGALGLAGRVSAVDALFEQGIPSRDPARAPISLAVATVALRNAPVMFQVLERRPDQSQAVDLMAEGFEMLEEDLEKERFFALVRRTYWASAEGSPTRSLMQTLINELDF